MENAISLRTKDGLVTIKADAIEEVYRPEYLDGPYDYSVLTKSGRYYVNETSYNRALKVLKGE